MEAFMLEEGLIVSAMGMGTVLSFLIILIFAMVVMYKILLFINKIFPEAVVEAAPAKKTSASNDEEIAIVLAATKAL